MGFYWCAGNTVLDGMVICRPEATALRVAYLGKVVKITVPSAGFVMYE